MYRINSEEFDTLMSDTMERCKNTLSIKANEYSRSDGRLHNFHVAARMMNCSPEKALLGMLVKHEVSVRDIVNDLDKGILPSDETLNEKLGDILNYYILLKALIVERRMNENKCD